MNGSTSYEIILGYLPEALRRLMPKWSDCGMSGLNEIRLHANGPVCFVYYDKTMFLSGSGAMASSYNKDSYILAPCGIAECVDRLSHYSLHSCGKQLAEGFFVVENGIRIGAAGAYSNCSPYSLTEITSLNFRIPRSAVGCADKLFSSVYCRNAMICGSVGSGKTTILRDICRLMGNIMKVSLIDERNEIACVYKCAPQYDVGVMTDIISGLDRASGIWSAVRTLSPDVIICDEIASFRDTEAVIDSVSCGVRTILTAHGTSIDEISRRKGICELIEQKAVDIIIFLSGASSPGKVREIVRL